MTFFMMMRVRSTPMWWSVADSGLGDRACLGYLVDPFHTPARVVSDSDGCFWTMRGSIRTVRTGSSRLYHQRPGVVVHGVGSQYQHRVSVCSLGFRETR
jgi:hypothetical protein